MDFSEHGADPVKINVTGMAKSVLDATEFRDTMHISFMPPPAGDSQSRTAAPSETKDAAAKPGTTFADLFNGASGEDPPGATGPEAALADGEDEMPEPPEIAEMSTGDAGIGPQRADATSDAAPAGDDAAQRRQAPVAADPPGPRDAGLPLAGDPPPRPEAPATDPAAPAPGAAGHAVAAPIAPTAAGSAALDAGASGSAESRGAAAADGRMILAPAGPAGQARGGPLPRGSGPAAPEAGVQTPQPAERAELRAPAAQAAPAAIAATRRPPDPAATVAAVQAAGAEAAARDPHAAPRHPPSEAAARPMGLAGDAVAQGGAQKPPAAAAAGSVAPTPALPTSETDPLAELVLSGREPSQPVHGRVDTAPGPGPSAAAELGLQRADTVRHAAAQAVEVFVRQPGKPVEITLNPRELGKVRMALSTTEAGVTVVILSERPETQELMRRHIDQLAQEFRSLGYENTAFQFGEETRGDDSPRRGAET